MSICLQAMLIILALPQCIKNHIPSHPRAFVYALSSPLILFPPSELSPSPISSHSCFISQPIHQFVRKDCSFAVQKLFILMLLNMFIFFIYCLCFGDRSKKLPRPMLRRLSSMFSSRIFTVSFKRNAC